jgi:hypothetical protein
MAFSCRVQGYPTSKFPHSTAQAKAAGVSCGKISMVSGISCDQSS